MENSQNTAEEIQEQAKAEAEKARQTAEEISEAAEGKLHHLRSVAGSRAHELGDVAQHRIDDQRDKVASRIEDAASRIRERGASAGPVGAAGERVAMKMESAASYLHDHESGEIASDPAIPQSDEPSNLRGRAPRLGHRMRNQATCFALCGPRCPGCQYEPP